MLLPLLFIQGFMLQDQMLMQQPIPISIYGRTFSTLGKPLDPISQDACAFYETQGMYKDFSGVVEEVDEGDEIAKALGDKKVIILQNHGILTTGPSVDIALWFYMSMERCCQAQLMAELQEIL